MTAFATHDDLANRLGITLTGPEQTRADALLATASDLVRVAARQTISKVTDDVLVVPGTWSDRIKLPERPVVSVSSVTATFYQGTPVTIPTLAWYVENDELVRYAFPVGLVPFFATGTGWLGPSYSISITYTHGYDLTANPTPYRLGLAKTVALEAVTRVWVNPAAMTQSMAGGVQESYMGGTGLMLTDEEEKDIADTFRRTNATLRLR